MCKSTFGYSAWNLQALNFTNVKLFTDGTSIFSIVNHINVSTKEINNDLKRISEWAYQWKMMFNSDLTEQAQEVIFSREIVKPFHPKLSLMKLQ